MVMTSVSASVILTYAFVQTQIVSTAVSQNVSQRGNALQAAQTGAAAAVQAMQTPTWGGVSTVLTGTLQSDSSGTLSYEVAYLPYPGSAGEVLDADAALKVLVQSTGKWQPVAVASGEQTTMPQPVTRSVQVLTQLMPRLPGRTIGSGDNAAARDLCTNPNEFDSIQSYALFSRSSSSSDFEIDPGVRLEGNIFVKQRLALFTDSQFGGSIQSRVQKDLKQRFYSTSGGQTVYAHPYPLSGTVNFTSNPNGGDQNDYSDSGVSWVKVNSTPVCPSISYSNWQQYRLFTSGFAYTAPTVNSTLQDTTLRPSAQNPLGIFYRNGSLTIYDDVTIQGTLVCTGKVTFNGDRCRLSSFNWKGTGGTTLVSTGDLWPRLPAVVADSVFFERDVSVIVEGGIISNQSVSGGGGQLAYHTVNDITYTGTATSKALQQPFSEVSLLNTVNLGSLTADGRYAIWLARGTSGNWYPITGIDAAARKLTVVGEVKNDAAVSYTIRRGRQQFIDLRGPLVGSTHDIYHCTEWDLYSSLWNTLYSAWQTAVSATPNGKSPPLFTEWLATPANFTGWPFPYSQVGLSLEPTFHARPTPGTYYLWSPPLFQPYQSSDTSLANYTGYRWKVLSWREVN